MVEQTVITKEDTRTEEIPIKEEKKKGFGQKFLNFLMMGGFLLIIIVIFGIILGVSLLTATPS